MTRNLFLFPSLSSGCDLQLLGEGATTDPPSMSMSGPWKRKKHLSLQAERMQKAKHSRQTPEAELSILALEQSPQDSGNEQINREHTEVTESGADLPHWSESDNQDSTAVGGSGGMEILQQPGPEDEQEGGLEGRKSWTLSISKMVVELVTQTRRTKILKMLAVALYESLRKRQKMSKMDAAQESASFTGQFFNLWCLL